MMVEHAIERVVCRLLGLPGDGRHDVWTDQAGQPWILSIGCPGGEKDGNRTKWDLKLRSELDRLSNFGHTTGGRVGQEALEMDDEYRWKHLDERLTARLVDARWIAHRLRVGDSCECVFYSMYRIVLFGFQCQSSGQMRGQMGKEGKRTWMSS